MTTPAYKRRGRCVADSRPLDRNVNADIRVSTTKRYAERYGLSFEETYDFFKKAGIVDYTVRFLGMSSDGPEYQDERIDRLVEKFYTLNPDYPRLW